MEYRKKYPHEIPPLDDEILLYSMDFAILVALRHSILPVLASAELTKVLTGLWAHVRPKLHLQPTDCIASYGDICKEEISTPGIPSAWCLNLLACWAPKMATRPLHQFQLNTARRAAINTQEA